MVDRIPQTLESLFALKSSLVFILLELLHFHGVRELYDFGGKLQILCSEPLNFDYVLLALVVHYIEFFLFLFKCDLHLLYLCLLEGFLLHLLDFRLKLYDTTLKLIAFSL